MVRKVVASVRPGLERLPGERMYILAGKNCRNSKEAASGVGYRAIVKYRQSFINQIHVILFLEFPFSVSNIKIVPLKSH